MGSTGVPETTGSIRRGHPLTSRSAAARGYPGSKDFTPGQGVAEHEMALGDLFSSKSRCGGRGSALADNPQIEARLKPSPYELRCLVCQNQTLADSNAPLAEDLRPRSARDDRQRYDDREIIDFLVQTVRDFVLYGRRGSRTTLLWLGPFSC